MTTRPLFAFCVVATLLVAGCSGQRPPPGIGAEPSRDITIFVDNLDFNDARIYISTGGGRTRLGNVSGKTRERFTREWRLPTIGFEVDLLLVVRKRHCRIGMYLNHNPVRPYRQSGFRQWNQ